MKKRSILLGMTTIGQATSVLSHRTLTGAWELDSSHSDSLGPLLQALGAPSLFSDAIARLLEKDVLHFHREDNAVSISYKRIRGLPFKLQSDLTFKVGRAIPIYSPAGVAQGHLLSCTDTQCNMIRHGPKKGESLEETFESAEDGRSLINHQRHVSPAGKETRARRVFRRIASG